MNNQSELVFRPASRMTDPATSHEAEAYQNAGPRAERMNQVLSIIRRHPGCTCGELARYMLKYHPELPVVVAVQTPHKRTTDLEDRGLIQRGPTRTCRDTGRNCITWYVRPADEQ